MKTNKKFNRKTNLMDVIYSFGLAALVIIAMYACSLA
jgi:hypothetical protein